MQVEHTITERMSPTHRLALCSCGWATQVPRRNALGASSKLRARIRAHEATTEQVDNLEPAPSGAGEDR